MKIYLSGPISNNPDYKDDFSKAEETARIYYPTAVILSPMVLPDGLEYKEYMSICLPMVAICDTIILLPGWDDSKGAIAEYSYAKSLGLKIQYMNKDERGKLIWKKKKKKNFRSIN